MHLSFFLLPCIIVATSADRYANPSDICKSNDDCQGRKDNKKICVENFCEFTDSWEDGTKRCKTDAECAYSKCAPGGVCRPAREIKKGKTYCLSNGDCPKGSVLGEMYARKCIKNVCKDISKDTWTTGITDCTKDTDCKGFTNGKCAKAGICYTNSDGVIKV